ncbi:hypothetical protein C7N83_12245 [Neisseria iguanae]|uniref:Uncharacterized protein n=1 Tax=Neisseria iguanae TaxID=90242 RepID=A0A2P7TXI0_9NEIS|nr:hypothetical protein C7N83_12245 [Neisseria iguanae]
MERCRYRARIWAIRPTPDKIGDVRTFSNHVCAGCGGDDLCEAFSESGTEMIWKLDARTDVKFVAS